MAAATVTPAVLSAQLAAADNLDTREIAQEPCQEKTAWPFYEQYRRIKNQYPDARSKLRGITFADDRLSFALQAADLVSSLIRREALHRFLDRQYDFQPLFEALTRHPNSEEKIISAGVAWCDVTQLRRLGEGHKAAKLDHGTVQLSDLSRQ